MAVLEELMRRGVIALPLHDGLMVARSTMGEAMGVMREKGLEVAGASIPVEVKR